jgi:hypothetical protein
MVRAAVLSSSLLLALIAVGGSAGCAPSVLAIEVTPRLAPACTPSVLTGPALGRGILDVESSVDGRGTYVGDLRLSSTDTLRVDGLRMAYAVPGLASAATQTAATKAGADIGIGDVLLVGDAGDIHKAQVANIELVPRDLAIALRDDAALALSRTTFATITVTMSALSTTAGTASETSSFTVDVCKGCLVEPLAESECAGGGVRASVCREGQDDAEFHCVAAAATTTTTH